jgi:hypothetical protein
MGDTGPTGMAGLSGSGFSRGNAVAFRYPPAQTLRGRSRKLGLAREVSVLTVRIDPRALLDCYLLDLDATLELSQRTAEKIERGLARTETFPARTPGPASATSGTLKTSRSLITEARLLRENASAARELLHELRGECEKLRRSLK